MTALPAPATPALSLRPYQTEKIAEARVLMSQGKRSICLVAPTGAGKTIIAAHIVQSPVYTTKPADHHP